MAASGTARVATAVKKATIKRLSPLAAAAAVMMVAAAATVGLVGCGSAARPAAEAGVGGKRYAFWPSAPDEPRIQFLVAFNTSDDLKAKRSGFQDLVYGSEKEETLSVAKPYGVAWWDGRVYVTDVRGKGVIVLDLKKQQTRVMGSTGAGAIGKGVDVVVSPSDGMKYVVDQAQSAVVAFDAGERFAGLFPLRDCTPMGVAVRGNLLYVTDFKQGHQHVKVLDRGTGQVVKTIGAPGGEDGMFVGPMKPATDKSGNLYVTDFMRARVQKFTPDGKFLMGFGMPGNRPGNFVRPKHLAVASDGITYVVDAAFNNVQMFDEEGKVMMFFGANGEHPGAMDLPAGIAVVEDNLEVFAKYVHPAFEMERVILVTNQFGNAKVSAYAMGKLKAGKTLSDLAGSRAAVAAGTEAATQPTTVPTTLPSTRASN